MKLSRRRFGLWLGASAAALGCGMPRTASTQSPIVIRFSHVVAPQTPKGKGAEKALGALPQVMAFSEVYQALQTGVVDGTENPPSNMYTQKMHEVQKHSTISNHGYLGYAVIVNKKFWDGLPPEVRAQLENAIAEATTYTNEIAQAENDDALDAMKKAGKTEFYTLTAAEKAAWKAKLLPVHNIVAGRIGKDLIEGIYQATGAA